MKKIIQYKNGIPIHKYRTVNEIQRKKGYSKGHISECLNGKRQTAYGCEWRYQLRRKGRIKCWFKTKKQLINDVGYLCDTLEERDETIARLEMQKENYKRKCNQAKRYIRKNYPVCAGDDLMKILSDIKVGE